MPRMTRGLWSAMAQVIDDEDRAAHERRARREVTKLAFAPAVARVDDFSRCDASDFAAPLYDEPAMPELAPVLYLDDYR